MIIDWGSSSIVEWLIMYSRLWILSAEQPKIRNYKVVSSKK